MVTTAGSASGMAATARLTAVRNITDTSSPRATPATNTTAQITTEAAASRRPSTASRFWSGVLGAWWALSSPATWPSSVAIPVATARPRARP